MITLIHKYFHILLISCLVFFASCAFHPPVAHKNGKTYGWSGGVFNGDWEDYYRSALSFMEGALYSEAIQSLDKAIDQRKKDKRMARTYGMHFLDYFPHREKGICYYFLGDPEAAKLELEYSLRCEQSAKALFYLNLVYKRIMENEGQVVGKPIISLNSDDELWSKADPIIITGSVCDKQLVDNLSVHDKIFFIEGAQKRIEFYHRFSLPEGTHSIEIKASNLLNGSAIKRMTIHADRSGPIIHFKKIISDDYIDGVLIDESNVHKFSINGRNISVNKGIEVEFHVSIRQMSLPVRFIAEDRLGNQTLALWRSGSLSQKNNRILLAKHTTSQWITDANTSLLSGTHFLPFIQLYGWPEQSDVFVEHVYIEGQLYSAAGISKLMINNRILPIKSGPMVFFSPSVKLDTGKNNITIIAEDRNGTTSSKTIVINRKIPEIHKKKYRLRLKTTSFEYPLNANPNYFFQHQLIQYLLDSHRFSIILNDMPETIIHNSQLHHPFARSEKDTSQSPESMLLGYSNQSNNGTEIVSRMIDMKTGSIIAINDIYYEKNDSKTQQMKAQQLVDKILCDFPLMEGYLTQINETVLLVPEKWSPEKGLLHNQWPLFIYDENPITNAITGQLLGSNTYVTGMATITSENMDGSCALQLNDYNQSLNDQSIWKAITK